MIKTLKKNGSIDLNAATSTTISKFSVYGETNVTSSRYQGFVATVVTPSKYDKIE